MRMSTPIPARELPCQYFTSRWSFDTERPHWVGFQTQLGGEPRFIDLTTLVQGMCDEARDGELLIWPLGDEIVLQYGRTFAFPRHRMETFISEVMERALNLPNDLSGEVEQS